MSVMPCPNTFLMTSQGLIKNSTCDNKHQEHLLSPQLNYSIIRIVSGKQTNKWKTSELFEVKLRNKWDIYSMVINMILIGVGKEPALNCYFSKWRVALHAGRKDGKTSHVTYLQQVAS